MTEPAKLSASLLITATVRAAAIFLAAQLMVHASLRSQNPVVLGLFSWAKFFALLTGGLSVGGLWWQAGRLGWMAGAVCGMPVLQAWRQCARSWVAKALLSVTSNALLNTCLGLALVLGILARVVGLEAQSYWVDELISAVSASAFSNFDGLFRQFVLTEPAMPPLFPVLHWMWMKMVGHHETAARSLSMLFSLATLGLVAFQARRDFNASTAKLLLLIFSLSEAAIFFAREARCYSLLLFWCVLAWFGWLRLYLQPVSVRLCHRLGLCVVCALAALTHYFGALLTGAFYLSLMWQDHRSLRKTMVWAGWATLALLPVVVWAIAQQQMAGTSMTSVSQPFKTPFVHSTWNYIRMVFGGHDAGVFLLLIWPSALAVTLTNAENKPRRNALHGVAFVLCIVMGVLFLASFRREVIQERYLIVILPGVYLAATLLLTRVLAPSWAAVWLVLFMGGGLAARAPGFWYPTKEQWREASALAHNLSSDVTAVVFVRETTSQHLAGDLIASDPASQSWVDQLWLYYFPPAKKNGVPYWWIANNLPSYEALQARRPWSPGARVLFVRAHGLPVDARLIATLRQEARYVHQYPLVGAEVIKVQYSATAAPTR